MIIIGGIKIAEKHAGGRPRIKIDYEAVEKLASIGCTQEEIADFLGCSVRTLLRNQNFWFLPMNSTLHLNMKQSA